MSSKELDQVYYTQLNILSWYFKNIDEGVDSYLFNFEIVLEILTNELISSLDEDDKDIERIIDCYTRLIDNHFKIVDEGRHGQPRVIKKLFPIGLLLNKHGKNEQVDNLINKIKDLYNIFLRTNSKFFEDKDNKIYGEPDEYALCKELDNLKEDLFENYRGGMRDSIALLKEEITRDDFGKFKDKITLCKDIEYKSTRYPF